MKQLNKYLPLVITLIVGAMAALYILNIKTTEVKDPHDHGGESEHADSKEHEAHADHKEHEEEADHKGYDEQAGHDDHDEKKQSDNDEHEGHGDAIEMSESAITLSKIDLLTAGPLQLKKILPLNGIVAPNRDGVAKISPRFPGIIKSLHKMLGANVKAGDTVAIVESNESLSPYPILAQLAGTVIEKNVSIGEFVDTEKALYTIANLNTVWIEFNVHREDYTKLRMGQKVDVTWENTKESDIGKITYLSPVGSENTQTLVARLTLPNHNKKWKLGLFVKGEAILETINLPLGVNIDGLQTVEGKEVVFVKEGGRFEARPVKMGLRSKEVVEILSGLVAGDIYAGQNSFILKADLGKSEAKHEH